MLMATTGFLTFVIILPKYPILSSLDPPAVRRGAGVNGEGRNKA
jgi:hypothetical protein